MFGDSFFSRNAFVHDGSIIFLDRNGIFRSTDGATSFDYVHLPVGLGFQGPVATRNAIFIKSRGIGVFRSADGGASFSPMEFLGPTWLLPLEIEDVTLSTSEEGAIQRSVDGGLTFEIVHASTGRPLRRPIAAAGAIFVPDELGGILRSTDTGLTFDEVHPQGERRIDTILEVGEAVFARGGSERLLVSTNGGASFMPVVAPNGENLNVPVAIDGTIFVTGWQGTILRSTDGGASFQTVRTAQGVELNAPIAIDGGALLVTGWDGSVLRSTDGGASFETVRDPDGDGLDAEVRHGDVTFITSTNGSILRVTDAGTKFEMVRGPGRERFGVPDAIGDGLLSVGTEGTILRWPHAHADTLRNLDLEPGSEGDVTLNTFLKDNLPPYLQNQPQISRIIARFDDIMVERRGLSAVRTATLEQRDQLDAMPWALLQQDQARLRYESYITICRAGTSTVEAIAACEEGWRAQQEVDTGNWWQTLASQVPPGILLLFLLATLSALYRYNMRLSGFHHSRADALELLSDDWVKKHDTEGLDRLSQLLAADLVEFGKTTVNWGAGSISNARHGS